MTRPTCINHGCNEPATYSRKDKEGNPRWRIHCSHCQAASYGKWPHRLGVTPFKQERCENHNGHLGFPCMTDFNLAPSWAKGLTEIDHIDGDPTNNDPANLKELCVTCHKLKGQTNGDYDNTRSRDKVDVKVKKNGKNLRRAHEAYERMFV